MQILKARSYIKPFCATLIFNKQTSRMPTSVARISHKLIFEKLISQVPTCVEQIFDLLMASLKSNPGSAQELMEQNFLIISNHKQRRSKHENIPNHLCPVPNLCP